MFAVYKKKEISVDEVAAVQLISLRKVSGEISISGGQYFLKCDCKAKSVVAKATDYFATQNDTTACRVVRNTISVPVQ